PLTGAVVVSTPSDVSLQDGRKAIEMFRTARVDILGMVENMSHFVCPHCHQEIDIFSKAEWPKLPSSSGCHSWDRLRSIPISVKAGTLGSRQFSTANPLLTPSHFLISPGRC